jgi:hypothetical protein
LQAKGAEMQLKKKTDYIDELRNVMKNRLAEEYDTTSIPPLKNANMNRGTIFLAQIFFLVKRRILQPFFFFVYPVNYGYLVWTDQGI